MKLCIYYDDMGGRVLLTFSKFISKFLFFGGFRGMRNI